MSDSKRPSLKVVCDLIAISNDSREVKKEIKCKSDRQQPEINDPRYLDNPVK